MPTSDSVTKRPLIPSDYPHAHRLADQHVFRAVLGIASSTFARLLAEGRLPKPTKIGRANRWREIDIARVAAEGVPPTVAA